MYKFKNKSKSKNMLKNISRKIGQQSKQVSRKISKRLNKTIRNDTTKVRQFYKSMLKKFKGGCNSCINGGKPMKGG